ncbi:unnamed protein product [Prunus armeniaca]|uniref:F-box domain-containing protein n=1 Tax=Prunus armeniaca TaxID=36596 RepID=A0A6J5W9S4_PRUAR|nr:unnamed protein product [Prunus armeniaca]
MDAGLWSKQLQELLERILSFLPLKNFMNLRLTCKHFKSLLFSPSLISKHSSSSPFSSFLLLSHPQCYNHFALYDSTLILSLQFLSCLQSFDQVLKNLSASSWFVPPLPAEVDDGIGPWRSLAVHEIDYKMGGSTIKAKAYSSASLAPSLGQRCPWEIDLNLPEEDVDGLSQDNTNIFKSASFINEDIDFSEMKFHSDDKAYEFY